MFSGKTEELIRRLRRAEFAKQRVEIFKPGVDTATHATDVVSHDATSIRSTPVPNSSNLLLLARTSTWWASMKPSSSMTAFPPCARELANSGVRVIAAGLDMDFQGRPFGPMPHLMAVAEYMSPRCTPSACSAAQLATFSHRTHASQDLIHLGENRQLRAAVPRLFRSGPCGGARGPHQAEAAGPP
jgi:thymidine kinase